MSVEDLPLIKITSEEANNAPSLSIPVVDIPTNTSSLSEVEVQKSSVRWHFWIGVAVLLMLGLAVALTLVAPSSQVPGKITGKSITTLNAGIKQEQLAITSPMLRGGWVKHTSGFWAWLNDEDRKEYGWSGSTVVLQRTKENHLLLVTNAHCLALDDLGKHSSSQDAVLAYGLAVQFPKTNQLCKVIRFARHGGDMDLALLEVDSSGLVEGENYIILPYIKDISIIKPGDELVAIGSPLDFFGTQTFGQISAIRSQNIYGEDCRTIQIDAAINHGNSGGPLMLKRNDRYSWIGVNTWIAAPGVNFAIHVSEVFEGKYTWYPADKHGASQALRQRYGHNMPTTR